MNSLNRYYDRLRGSVVACIGFVLSPLSWWNDLYVNIPIAYVCAWLVSLFYPDAFLSVFAGSYLATNVLGFILLHKGINKTLSKDEQNKIRYTGKNIIRDIAISLFYTGLMVVLIKLQVIRPVQHYLK
ncbi:MAG: hypothetical protein HZA17_10655 [Nitrospirae bacterium]|nr:hypothetical protein [Nitrospirota bacterium]